SAAEKIAEEAIVVPGRPAKPIRIEPEKLSAPPGATIGTTGSRILMSNGDVGIDFPFPRNGEYVFRVRAYQQQTGPDPAHMVILVDGKEVAGFDVRSTQDSQKLFEAKAPISAG